MAWYMFHNPIVKECKKYPSWGDCVLFSAVDVQRATDYLVQFGVPVEEAREQTVAESGDDFGLSLRVDGRRVIRYDDPVDFARAYSEKFNQSVEVHVLNITLVNPPF